MALTSSETEQEYFKFEFHFKKNQQLVYKTQITESKLKEIVCLLILTYSKNRHRMQNKLKSIF